MDKLDCPSDNTDSSSSWEFVEEETKNYERDKKDKSFDSSFKLNSNNESDTDGISIISENEECQHLEESDSDEGLFKSIQGQVKVSKEEELSCASCDLNDKVVGSNSHILTTDSSPQNEANDIQTLSAHETAVNSGNSSNLGFTINPYLTRFSMGFVVLSLLIVPLISLFAKYYFVGNDLYNSENNYESKSFSTNECGPISETCLIKYLEENKGLLDQHYCNEKVKHKKVFEEGIPTEYVFKNPDKISKLKNKNKNQSVKEEKLKNIEMENNEDIQETRNLNSKNYKRSRLKIEGNDFLYFDDYSFKRLSKEEYSNLMKKLKKKIKKLKSKANFLKQKENYLEEKEDELLKKEKKLNEKLKEKRRKKIQDKGQDENSFTDDDKRQHDNYQKDRDDIRNKNVFGKQSGGNHNFEKEDPQMFETKNSKEIKWQNKEHSREDKSKGENVKKSHSQDYFKQHDKNKKGKVYYEKIKNSFENFKNKTRRKFSSLFSKENKNQTVSGEWYNELYNARDKIRKEEHASDWLFEMYNNREKKRKDNINNSYRWYFNKGNVKNKKKHKDENRAWMDFNYHTHFKR